MTAYEDLDKKLDYLNSLGCKIDKGQFEIGDRLIFDDVSYKPARNCWWVGERKGRYDEQMKGTVKDFVKFLKSRRTK